MIAVFLRLAREHLLQFHAAIRHDDMLAATGGDDDDEDGQDDDGKVEQ